MNFQLKYLLLPTLLTVLAGCDDSSSSSTNEAPVLATPEALETEYSTYQSVYDVSTELDVMQVQYTFQETDTFTNVDYYDIDLLKGFIDPDNNALLTIKNMQFVWTGPDCSDTLVTAANYPEICEPILTSLGYEIGQTGLVFSDIEIIRDAQNLPKTDGIMYGFELKQSVLRVTPTEFIPVLYQDEKSVVSISFDISDGIDSTKHYVLATVVGKNVAPEFIQLNDDGSPKLITTDTGEKVKAPVLEHNVPVSEKGEDVTIDILAGIYDEDIYKNQVIAREVGDLDEYYTHYNDNSYRVENLGIQGVTANITFDGVTDPRPAKPFTEEMAVRDPITNALIGYNLTFKPYVFADQLEKGQEGTVTFNFFVTDGNGDNSVARSATFVVTGANEFNEPEFKEDLIAAMKTNGDITTFDLLEGVLDADGDEMEVINLVVPPEAEQFGITVTQDNTIVVDPYAFLYLNKGEQEVFNFTYNIMDSTSRVSALRTFTLGISAANVNLVNNGTFESGVWDNGWKQQTPDAGTPRTAINAEGAYTGNFGVEMLVNDTAIRLLPEGIAQGEIGADESFYVTWQTKSKPFAEGGTGPYTNVVLTVKDATSTTDANVYSPVFSKMPGVHTQVLHTVDFPANDFFDEGKNIALNFQAKASATIDDVAMVKYKFSQQRNLVKEGTFTNGTAPSWETTGTAVLSLTEDANRYSNDSETQYGLEVVNGANVSELRLTVPGLKQGTLKKGIRYVLEFDFRNKANGKDSFQATLADTVSGNNVRKTLTSLSTSPTLWQNVRFHFVNDSDSRDENGPLATDPTFDWSVVDNAIVSLKIAAGVTIQIDNVRLYPVPE